MGAGKPPQFPRIPRPPRAHGPLSSRDRDNFLPGSEGGTRLTFNTRTELSPSWGKSR
jgi:hypothetical protein